MKPKHFFLSLLTLLVASVLTVSLVSCGDDDDDEDTDGVTLPVTGTWQSTEYDANSGARMYLGKDGTATLFVYIDGDSINYKGTFTAQWATEDGDLTLRFTEPEQTTLYWQYTITNEGKNMTTKEKFGSGTIAWTRQ